MKLKESDAGLRLVVRRTFAARRDKVFRAWTDPEQIVKWMSPSEGVVTEFADFDLKVGGLYRIGYRTPKGLVVVGGAFSQVIVPEKLVYSWIWEPPLDIAGVETVVTVEFLEQGNATELVLTHERFSNQNMRERHEHGWTGTLASLAAFVSQS
jgi:uncharacterized protein YndB with AHSA1/START domain